ncbi:hypothetical protein V8C86DRAFT_3152117 [Haematococcus lacustris]
MVAGPTPMGGEARSQAAMHLFPLASPDTGQQPDWPVPAALPAPHINAQELASVITGDVDGGNDLTLIDQYLALLTGQGGAACADTVGLMASGQQPYLNMTRLGLDRAALERQGVAAHHINRLHHMLHVRAVAYARAMASEQRRLAGLMETKEGSSLADRLLTFLTGCEACIMDDLARPATAGPHAPDSQGARWPTSRLAFTPRPASLQAPYLAPEAVTEPSEDTMRVEEIVAMAAAGNVVGMRRLLSKYRQLHLAVRQRLEGRLQHETARAQRLQARTPPPPLGCTGGRGDAWGWEGQG